MLGVLTRLSHSNATRGKLMCPGPRRSITACDGTSASALNRNHRSTSCGKKTPKTKRARRLLKEYLNNYCCSVDESWCVCGRALGLSQTSLVCRFVPLLIAAVSPDCCRSSPGDTRGTLQSPNPEPRAPSLNLAARANSEAILMLNK